VTRQEPAARHARMLPAGEISAHYFPQLDFDPSHPGGQLG
jgi:hypothetical protein